jgi:hypothetical protein
VDCNILSDTRIGETPRSRPRQRQGRRQQANFLNLDALAEPSRWDEVAMISRVKLAFNYSPDEVGGTERKVLLLGEK